MGGGPWSSRDIERRGGFKEKELTISFSESVFTLGLSFLLSLGDQIRVFLVSVITTGGRVIGSFVFVSEVGNDLLNSVSSVRVLPPWESRERERTASRDSAVELGLVAFSSKVVIFDQEDLISSGETVLLTGNCAKQPSNRQHLASYGCNKGGETHSVTVRSLPAETGAPSSRNFVETHSSLASFRTEVANDRSDVVGRESLYHLFGPLQGGSKFVSDCEIRKMEEESSLR